jgi:DeoR family transcriptional regulator, suf operon transcriptional repressor
MPGSTPLPVVHFSSLDGAAAVNGVRRGAGNGAESMADVVIQDFPYNPPMPPASHANGRGIGHRALDGNVSPSALRREILFRLRQHGPASPDQLASQFGSSRTGVLQQLRALESAHLVSRQTVRHGVGRPRHMYDVTADAQDLFPSNYDGLATGLLAAVRAVGGEELIEDLFAARRRQMGDRIRQQLVDRLPADAPLESRVRQLAVIQDEQGYLCQAVVGVDGTIRLQEHNCAIFRVANANPAACAAELGMFADALGVPVVRESHIAAGDRCCSYRIGPANARADGIAELSLGPS